MQQPLRRSFRLHKLHGEDTVEQERFWHRVISYGSNNPLFTKETLLQLLLFHLSFSLKLANTINAPSFFKPTLLVFGSQSFDHTQAKSSWAWANLHEHRNWWRSFCWETGQRCRRSSYDRDRDSQHGQLLSQVFLPHSSFQQLQHGTNLNISAYKNLEHRCF